MALFKSHLVTQASGSVGGTTYAHTGSGLYMRARSIPVNPNTGAQLAVRSALTALVMAWIETLTAAQRASWDLWASNVQFTNPLGDSFNISGQNAYIGANTARLQANSKLATSLLQINTAPTAFDRGEFSTPTFTADDTNGIDVSFETADEWVEEDDAALLIYQGQPKNPSRNYFRGPYRLVAAIIGNSTNPPTSPETITNATLNSLGFVIDDPQSVWLKFVCVRADGRYSSPRVVGPVTVTDI